MPGRAGSNWCDGSNRADRRDRCYGSDRCDRCDGSNRADRTDGRDRCYGGHRNNRCDRTDGRDRCDRFNGCYGYARSNRRHWTNRTRFSFRGILRIFVDALHLYQYAAYELVCCQSFLSPKPRILFYKWEMNR